MAGLWLRLHNDCVHYPINNDAILVGKLFGFIPGIKSFGQRKHRFPYIRIPICALWPFRFRRNNKYEAFLHMDEVFAKMFTILYLQISITFTGFIFTQLSC